eukprot:TRINITY_DN15970_c0_g1_i2.p1 TRINITY_DN15970_c0_g1~~TRINITY_DN15970_c0_g1_i2.p1  ORF type:complete len:1387 (+),score=332.29 TRINITY_DN15970_c0_g1_i2:136-4296(+)
MQNSEAQESGDQTDETAPQQQQSQTAGKAAQLSFHCTLGFGGQQTDQPRQVEHLSDGVVIYNVGKHLAIYNYETSQYQFILKQSKTQEVLCFALTSNRKYLALSEQLAEEKPGGSTEVSVWALLGSGAKQDNSNLHFQVKKTRSLSFAYLSKQPVVAMGFSRENKLLSTATSAPEGFIYIWQLDKAPARLVAMAEHGIRVSHVSISPWSSSSLCTSGMSGLRIWKFSSPNQLKPVDPMVKRREYRYSTHVWFDDEKLVVGTVEGDILVFEYSELKKVLHTVHDENHAICSIVTISRGIAVAGDGGYLSIFERTYDSTLFHIYRCFQTHAAARITTLTVSPNEEYTFCMMSDNTASLFSLVNVDIIEPDKNASSSGGHRDTVFKPLSLGFHNGQVTAISTCVQKNIIVTCSIDRHIRVWNFVKKKTEIDSSFDEEVSAVSCHPSGLRIVAAFKYRLAMFCVLASDLHAVQEFPVKHCKQLSFSKGGHFFAASVVTKIYIYNSFTFACIGFLSGHSSMVRSMVWTNNDQQLISAGYEGAIHTWTIETCKREPKYDISSKAVAHSSIAYDDDSKVLVSVGTNKVPDLGFSEGSVTLRAYEMDQGGKKGETPQAGGSPQQQQQQISEPAEGASGHCQRQPILLGAVQNRQTHGKPHTRECVLSLLHKTLFVGTVTGHIRAYPWPLPPGQPQPSSIIDAHQSSVAFLLLSSDESLLFSVGNDNTLFAFEITSAAAAAVGNQNNASNAIPNHNGGKSLLHSTFSAGNSFEDVAYFLQSDLEVQIDKIEQLTELNQELELKQGHDLKHHRQQFESAVDQKRSETAAQVEVHYQRTIQAQKEKESTLHASAEKTKELETHHLKAAEDLEVLYKARTDALEHKYHECKDMKDDLIVRYENKLQAIRHDWDKTKERMKLEAAEFEQNKKQEMEQLQKRREIQKQDGDLKLEQLEQEYEEEIKHVKAKYQQEKEKLDVQCEKDILQWNIGHRSQEKDTQDLEKLQRDLKSREDILSRAILKNKEHDKANDALRLEIDVRIDTIGTSEKKILELQKQTTELEKLRYVLAFKFNELRKDVAPKEDQIKIMQERMKEMEQELAKVTRDSNALHRALEAKEDKLQVVHREIGNSKRNLEGKSILIKGLLRRLKTIAESSPTRRLLYDIRDVVEKCTTKEDISLMSANVIHDFHRQRIYSENQFSSLKKQNERRELNLSQDNHRKAAENSLLVREINELRHEKKGVLEKVRIVENEVKELKQQLGKSAGGSPAPVRRPSTAASTPAGRVRAMRKSGPETTAKSLFELAESEALNIAEVVHQVEQNNQEMGRQQHEIVRLREFVLHLLNRAKLDPSNVKDASRIDQIQRELSLSNKTDDDFEGIDDAATTESRRTKSKSSVQQ